MNLNFKIKERREELGITLQQVANHLGVSKATVQRYESGEIKNIKLETIEKIAEILKVTPAYLMGWEEKKNNLTIAAHLDVELTTEEQKEINKYIEFLLSRRKK